MGRRRLLLTITELRPAGAERIVFELATRLPTERWEVAVCSLHSPGGVDGAVADRLRAADVPVHAIRMRGKLDVFGASRFREVVREFRPELLNAHLFHASLAARWVGAGLTPVVSTIHVVDRRPRRLRRVLERLGARRDLRTVCVSDAVAAHARRDLGVRDPVVIHDGLDLGRFERMPRRDKARAELDLPEAARVIGFVGRLTEQKGVDTLLRACARPELSGALCVIAGDGEAAAALRALAVELGLAERVRFLGFRSDVRPLLAAVDVFAMPSRWEGFGLALVEAMAAGLPVVASDVDSLPEVLGDAGALVPVDDPQALALELAQILGDSGRQSDLAARARRRATSFGVDRMVAAYDRLFSDLCESGT